MDPELEQHIAAARAEIASFGPAERATCLMLIAALVRASNAADAWSAECEAICEALVNALRSGKADIREDVTKILRDSFERMGKRIATLQGEVS